MDKNDKFDEKGNSEDDFGLPNVEYQPLDNEGDSTKKNMGDEDSSQDSDPNKYIFAEEEPSKTPLVIGLVVAILVIGVAGFLAYNFIIKPKAEKERQEELARKKRELQERKEKEEARLAQEKARAAQQAMADSIAQASNSASPQTSMNQNNGEKGTVEAIDARTGRYYAVLSSGLDDDLLMDYAKKLATKGVNTKIISPYGRNRLYRLVASDGYATLSEAQGAIEDMKSNYGSSTWVLKY